MATVRAQLGPGVTTEITARQHTWLADEPVSLGGSDEGPNPYELLLGSLAACITITLRLYANHKGIALDGVDVDIEFDRVHAEDCMECDDPGGGLIERMRSRVTFRGTFDEAQRKRLAQVAQRCPVHKTLARGVQIFDSVSFGE